jgi:hypothetical protein
MQGRWLVLAVSSLLLAGQTAHAQTLEVGRASSGTNVPPISPSPLSPEAPVITIDGICDTASWSIARPAAKPGPGATGCSGVANPTTGNAATDANPCQLSITRADFERLAGVVTPNTAPQSDLQLARVYSDLLVSALKAHELRLDQDPHFDDILKFTYVQVLSRALNTHLQEQANEQANAEIDKYYQEHPHEFEQVHLLQISVPKRKLHPNAASPAPTSKQGIEAEETAMKAEAEKIHARAVAGEDFEKLQEEAYAFAGNADAAPDADMGNVTRAEVGQFQDQIFAMPLSQVSELTSGAEAWHIVKVVSRRMMPRDEASQRLSSRRMKEALGSLKNSATPHFSGAYFQNPDDAPKMASPEGHN